MSTNFAGLMGTLRATSVYNAKLSRDFVANLDPLLVWDRFAKFEPINEHEGLGVEFEIITSFTPAEIPLADGIAPSAYSVSNSKIQATLGEYGSYVEFTNRLKKNAQRDYLTKIAERQRVQMAITRDLVIRNAILSNATNKLYANGAAYGDINTPITANLLDNAEINLMNNNAQPITKMIKGSVAYEQVSVAPCFICIVHPHQVHDLKQIQDFVPAEKYASQIHPMEVGKRNMIRFIASSLAVPYRTSSYTTLGADTGASDAASSGMRSTTGTKNDVYVAPVFGADAYAVTEFSKNNSGIIVKDLTEGGSANPLNQLGSQGWIHMVTAQVIQNDAMYLLYSASSKVA